MTILITRIERQTSRRSRLPPTLAALLLVLHSACGGARTTATARAAAPVAASAAETRAPFTDADRSGLEVTSTGIRHRLLGFSIPHPGAGFVEDTAGTRAANERLRALALNESMHMWSIGRDDPLGVVVVQITSSYRDSEDMFRGLASGMRLRGSASSSSRVLVDTLTWTPEKREFRFMTQQASTGLFMSWRCLPSMAAHPRPFIVCAMSAALDTTGLARFTDGLSVMARP
jgi:hypothetical protein